MIGPDFKAIENASTGFNTRQKLVLLSMDALLLMELTFCLWLAYLDPNNLTATFIKCYLPMFLPTLIGGVLLARRFRDPAPTRGEASGILDNI
jgi:uncharacterized membrane protein